MRAKSEIRTPKYETNPNPKFRMTKINSVLNFDIRICFGFRVSDFVFAAQPG